MDNAGSVEEAHRVGFHSRNRALLHFQALARARGAASAARHLSVSLRGVLLLGVPAFGTRVHNDDVSGEPPISPSGVVSVPCSASNRIPQLSATSQGNNESRTPRLHPAM